MRSQTKGRPREQLWGRRRGRERGGSANAAASRSIADSDRSLVSYPASSSRTHFLQTLTDARSRLLWRACSFLAQPLSCNRSRWTLSQIHGGALAASSLAFILHTLGLLYSNNIDFCRPLVARLIAELVRGRRSCVVRIQIQHFDMVLRMVHHFRPRIFPLGFNPLLLTSYAE